MAENPPHRRSLFARIARTLAVLLVLALLALALAPPILSLGPGRRLAAAVLSALTAANASVGEFRSWWIGDIRLEDVALRRPGQTRPFLAARTLHLRFDLTRSPRELLVPARISFDKPTLVLQTGELRRAFARPAAPGTLTHLYARSGLTEVAASGGRVVLRRADRPELVLSDLSGAVRLDRDTRRLTVEADAQRRLGEETRPLKARAAFDVLPDQPGGLLQLKGEASFETPGLTVSAKLSRDDPPRPQDPGRLDLKIETELARLPDALALLAPAALRPTGTAAFNVRIDLWPDGRRRLDAQGDVRDVRLDLPSWGLEPLAADSLSLALRAQRLPDRGWTIPHLVVRSPESRLYVTGELRLRPDAAGQLNAKLSGPGPAAVFGQWFLWELNLEDDLRFASQGNAEIDLALAGERCELTGLWLLHQPRVLKGRKSVPLPEPAIQTSIKGAFRLAPSLPGELVLDVKGRTLTGRAACRAGGAAPQWDMTAETDAAPWSDLVGALYPELGLAARGRFEGDIRIRGEGPETVLALKLRSPEAALRVKSSLQKAPLDLPLGKTVLEADFQTRAGRFPVVTRTLELTSGLAHLNVNREGPITASPLPPLAIRCESPGDRLAECLPPLLPASLKLHGPLELRSRLVAPETAPRLEFELSAGALDYAGGWHAEKPALEGSWGTRKLDVRLRPAKVAEGTVSAAFQADFTAATPAWKLEVKTEKVLVNQKIDFLQFILPIVTADEGRVAAALTADVSLAGQGLGWTPEMLQTVKGRGKILMEQGQIVANGLTADFLALIGKADRYAFSKLEGEFDVENGKIHHRRIAVGGDPFDMRLVGWIGLDGSIRFELSSDVLRKNLSPEAVKILSKLTTDPFKSPFIIYGSVTKPRVYITWLEGTGLDELLAQLQDKGRDYKLTAEDRERGLKALERLLRELEKLEEPRKPPAP
jgi:hypothetical protein